MFDCLKFSILAVWIADVSPNSYVLLICSLNWSFTMDSFEVINASSLLWLKFCLLRLAWLLKTFFVDHWLSRYVSFYVAYICGFELEGSHFLQIMAKVRFVSNLPLLEPHPIGTDLGVINLLNAIRFKSLGLYFVLCSPRPWT